jgi:hypothetical protein
MNAENYFNITNLLLLLLLRSLIVQFTRSTASTFYLNNRHLIIRPPIERSAPMYYN